MARHKIKKFISSSSEETKQFAEAFAKRIVIRKSSFVNRKHALVLALMGELGSGKTTFVQGFFRGLGIKRRATSPTFIIMRRMKLAAHHNHNYDHNKKRKSHRHSSWYEDVFHVDAYRIKKPKELLELGFKEILDDPKNIVLIEWADRIKNMLPKNILRIKFRHHTEYVRTILW